MKTFTAILVLFAGAVLAQPAAQLARRSGVCTDLLYSVPTCCSTDVLGVADLSCSTPSSASSGPDLMQSCGAEGKAPKCCTLGLAEIGVLCQDAVGA
ncbi:hypothetical protein QQS21_010838 [Conoideocrella luteorostrata]|uniref:Cerato-ulmin n=1 Tax=Conoideocrella luteorostrata TaxID=1105319 RepID=A0AAJ0FP26_9HYPO|nr:hypothetical protein QQS21_010838 [Conoideocrella luteorostrata]